MPTIQSAAFLFTISPACVYEHKNKRITGVGPASLAWEARVLAMYYIREPLHYNFFPSKKQRDFQKLSLLLSNFCYSPSLKTILLSLLYA